MKRDFLWVPPPPPWESQKGFRKGNKIHRTFSTKKMSLKVQFWHQKLITFILWSNIQKRKENIENGLFFKVIHFYNKIIVKKLLLKIYANLGAEARVS